MNNEMYAANVKNWLMDIATGAKAMKKSMQFAPCKKDQEWKVTASCYDKFTSGVAIHQLRQLAEVIDVQVSYIRFGEKNPFTGDSAGYCYFDMFGVRFYDLISEEDIPDEWK